MTGISESPATEPDRAQPAGNSRRLGPLWRVVRTVLLVVLIFILLVMIFENSFIFIPFETAYDDWQPSGLQLEEVRFESGDGTRLHGWYVPHETPRAVVLFCHGNAGNLSHRADILRLLHDRVGVATMIFDYRGYGRSEGKPREAGVLADARAARAWLAERAGIDPQKIVLMGRSLGGAVAVDLAAEDGARALVLESTFTSIPDLAAHHYPFLPVRWLLRTQLDSQGKIADYHGPLLQSHSEDDTIIPFRFGKRLFEAANEPKQLITFEGINHNDPSPSWYYDELAKFLDKL